MSACVACQKPLEVEFEPEDYDEDVQMGGSSGKAPAAAPDMVPDDVHLNCGCHFHWDCLLEAYQITECPSCGKNIASTSAAGAQQVLVTLNNEGGLQENLDILPLLTEESYLKAYPADRKCRAFLEFCREGDMSAIIGMLQGDNESDSDSDDDMADEAEGEGEDTADVGIDALLRYQDPIGDMQSGLHAAVQAQSREVAWLLLLLASNLPLLEFPPEVFQEAEALGIMRGLTEDKTDIRSMRDANGKTAEDVAREVGGVWAAGWIGNGRLAI
ncbi:hypothetical protein DPSP01_000589 [Paraphaeosphaeria sporulosa]|uniref:Uncharacterized protein n=1 Tax=Paraphaeosphaeria sporulosa TaxID=1460663 RepID=A0A177CAB6_9PLEO|nr:uncharacterized protein CC84DRAFT_1095977 [Paraphaeosphaeria sporulosa]OAG03707.1 hypothetical protein CC84DRAFT_1095977 [Paraphaeosphaeria sporulosa]